MSEDDKYIKEMLKNTIAELEIDETSDQLPITIIPTTSDIEDRETDISDDYSLVRSTLRTQLQLMDAASRSALIGLIASQHPKSVEAFSALMTTMSNTADKLLKAQKDIKDIKGSASKTIHQPGQGFVGTSTDLLSQFGDAQDPIYVIDNEATET